MNEPYRANCLFCGIIKNQIPSSKVYEDEKFTAILDIHPVTKGHTLLIAKDHYEWMVDAPDEVIAEIYKKAKELMIKIKKALGCDYVQISVVGKEISHFHIHLIPRYMNDAIELSPTAKYDSPKELLDFADKIKNAH